MKEKQIGKILLRVSNFVCICGICLYVFYRKSSEMNWISIIGMTILVSGIFLQFYSFYISEERTRIQKIGLFVLYILISIFIPLIMYYYGKS